MSFVGPRPDIPGYYDTLEGEARKIITLKPGLFSWAALKYYNEETLLKSQDNAQYYNNNIIFPDKVSMNLEYYYKRSLKEDLKILLASTKKNNFQFNFLLIFKQRIPILELVLCFSS